MRNINPNRAEYYLYLNRRGWRISFQDEKNDFVIQIMFLDEESGKWTHLNPEYGPNNPIFRLDEEDSKGYHLHLSGHHEKQFPNIKTRTGKIEKAFSELVKCMQSGEIKFKDNVFDCNYPLDTLNQIKKKILDKEIKEGNRQSMHEITGVASIVRPVGDDQK